MRRKNNVYGQFQSEIRGGVMGVLAPQYRLLTVSNNMPALAARNILHPMNLDKKHNLTI